MRGPCCIAQKFLFLGNIFLLHGISPIFINQLEYGFLYYLRVLMPEMLLYVEDKLDFCSFFFANRSISYYLGKLVLYLESYN